MPLGSKLESHQHPPSSNRYEVLNSPEEKVMGEEAQVDELVPDQVSPKNINSYVEEKSFFKGIEKIPL